MMAMAMVPAAASAQTVKENAVTKRYQLLQQRPDRLLVTLPNRMIVVAQQLRTAPVVTAQVYVKTGSIYEQEHAGAGLSHFLEHLVSGGTTDTHSEAESNAILGRIGAATNASTGLTRVHYYINTTSDHTSDAIALLSDWLGHSKVDQREYERERSVIEREFEMGLGDPRRIFWKLTQQARFGVHPARYPTIGYLDEFLTVSRDEIYDFYKRMYVPNNMVFVVVGDIDKQQVVDQVARLWSDAPARQLPQLSFPVEPAITQPRQLSSTADIDRPRLRLAWPGTRLAAEGDYALDLLAVILGQGESSRLVRTVRDQHRAANTIDAYNLSWVWGEGFFGIDANIAAITSQENGQPLPDEYALAAAKELILRQVQLLRTEGVTQEEVARAKRKIMADVVYSGQSAEALARRLATDLISMGDPDYLQQYAKHIGAVTAKQIMAAADHFLTPSRMITVTLLPTAKNEEPEKLVRPQLGAVADSLPRKSVELDNTVLIGKIALAVAARQEQAAPIVTEPAQYYVLTNGLRVVIARSTLVPAVAIQMYQVGGLLADDPGKQGLARSVARMRIRGAGDRSAQDIAMLTDALGASLITDSGNNTSFTRAVCLKDDLETILQLVRDVVLHPTFPDSEWRKMQPRLLAAIDRETDSWWGELNRHFRKVYFDHHVWSTSPAGLHQAVEQFSADDLHRAYVGRLSAGASVLAIFGDVEPQQVIWRVETLFANMPATAQAPFASRLPGEPISGVRQFITKKPLGAVLIGLGPGATRSSGDYPLLQVLTRVMGRFPSGWLNQELRGKGEGLVYAVGSWQVAGLVPGYVAIYFNATPDKLPEALQRTAHVVRRARNELVDETTLAAAKAFVLRREFFDRQSNGDRATNAALNAIYGLPPNQSQVFRRQVQQIDARELRIIAQTYLRNPVAVVISHETIPQQQLIEATGAMTPAATNP